MVFLLVSNLTTCLLLAKFGFFSVHTQIALSQLMKRLQKLFCSKLIGIESVSTILVVGIFLIKYHL